MTFPTSQVIKLNCSIPLKSKQEDMPLGREPLHISSPPSNNLSRGIGMADDGRLLDSRRNFTLRECGRASLYQGRFRKIRRASASFLPHDIFMTRVGYRSISSRTSPIWPSRPHQASPCFGFFVVCPLTKIWPSYLTPELTIWLEEELLFFRFCPSAPLTCLATATNPNPLSL